MPWGQESCSPFHLARPAAGPVFDRSPRPACAAPV